MTAPVLAIRDLSKSYGRLPALRGVSLEVHAGERFGLVGANGAGKTTLFKCVLDFCATDGGRIELMGEPHRSPAARRALAYLPENFLPPAALTGWEFLRYVQKLRGQPWSESTARSLCEALELDPAALGRLARTYSKGMMRKLGLIACLQSGASLLFLDEPMSGLDPKARVLLKAQLSAWKARGGTLFFSSHSLADVDELCERMAILHEGALRFVGTPQACRAQWGAATLEAAYLAAIA